MSLTQAVAISPEQMTWSVPPLEDPAAVKAHVLTLHGNPSMKIDSMQLDELLYGITNSNADIEIGKTLGEDNVKQQYSAEKSWFPASSFCWTPYTTVRAVVRGLELQEGTTAYDLGSGYGRVPLYAGITTVAQCKGLELMGERVDLARRAQERLELENVEFTEGSVRDFDYSDGDVFYMYSPFERETLDVVLVRLEEIARNKPIKVVVRGQEHIFAEMPWLKRVKRVGKPVPGTIDFEVAVFESDM